MKKRKPAKRKLIKRKPVKRASKVKAKPKPKRPTFRKSPPKRGTWVNRKQRLGSKADRILLEWEDEDDAERAYEMIDYVRKKGFRKKDKKPFIRYIKSLGFSDNDAFTFWFSPPT